jgi:PhoPQ-activated pathogenicity-related protein
MSGTRKSLHLFALLWLIFVAGCGAGTGQSINAAQQCFERNGGQFNEILTCYRAAEALQPLSYAAKETTQLPGLQKRHYELTSLDWPQDGIVKPGAWKHDVDIYIPDEALTGRALIVVNNGINIASENNGLKPLSDFTEAMTVAIARQTKTIIVSISNVPNQYLTYANDGIPRREDSSVSHSWKLFLEAPELRPFMSVHVPMMESIVKAMDMAEKELKPWHIDRFIVTGRSKRAWASWLAAISDPRIDAIVPFVIDVLGMDKVLDHTYRTYGGNWPLAFRDYQAEGITLQRKTGKFDKLLQIEDPLRYLNSQYAQRLSIPKYIVNASGDDFFVPDNARFYFDQLPGVKSLRVAPNSDHYGIQDYLETSLIPFINRFQHAVALPTASMDWAENSENRESKANLASLVFSEKPVKIIQWTASNPTARDFRYACGIRYQALNISPAQKLTVSVPVPAQGWTASFVEAHFADGFVMTTPTRIFPDTYPAGAPAELGPACKTIPE